MKSETYYHLKQIINLQHDLALQELELKRMQAYYDQNVLMLNETQAKIQKLQILKQTSQVQILKLDIDYFKLNNKLE